MPTSDKAPRKDGRGIVFLIGAGPGDPGLLTVKGLACLRRANVVVYDYLVNRSLLKEVLPTAEIVNAGKRKGEPVFTQDAINALLIDRAKLGHIVARLKGGDPFVFGRGGEEALALADAGVPFEVVPGVTSVVAGPAYAGIPLTHREYAAAVTFTTGHEDPNKAESAIPWKDLAVAKGTLVFVMGMTNLPGIVSRLTTHGRSPDTPVAIIRWGTLPNQHTVVGRLGTIVEETAQMSLDPPGLIVVGEVVLLRDRLQWFERRPLFGKRVIVTRAATQSAELVARLEEAGAEVVEAPTIRVEPPPSWESVDRAIENLTDYRWILLTSVNAVRCFFDRLFGSGRDARSLNTVRVCVIGEKTALEVRRYGVVPDRIAKESTGEGLVASFGDEDLAGIQILFPRARVARETVRDMLTARGARVDVVPVYENRSVETLPARVREVLAEPEHLIVTFTSPSTVTGFLAGVRGDEAKRLHDVTIACVGPTTAEAVRAQGLLPAIQASRQTMAALVEAVVAHVVDGTP